MRKPRSLPFCAPCRSSLMRKVQPRTTNEVHRVHSLSERLQDHGLPLTLSIGYVRKASNHDRNHLLFEDPGRSTPEALRITAPESHFGIPLARLRISLPPAWQINSMARMPT